MDDFEGWSEGYDNEYDSWGQDTYMSPDEQYVSVDTASQPGYETSWDSNGEWDYNNYAGTPGNNYMDMPGDYYGYPSSLPDFPTDTNNPMRGGTQDFLGKLFSNPQALLKGLAAIFEGSQNKKMSKQLNSLGQNAAFDPFGSQRPHYQGLLKDAVANPFSSPIVAQQVAALQAAQSRKDAAAGRRSNVVGSAPQVMGASAKIAQDYINSLQRPAGAYIDPNSNALATLFQNAAKYGTSGYISPMMSALGSIFQQGGQEDSVAKMMQLMQQQGQL